MSVGIQLLQLLELGRLALVRSITVQSTLERTVGRERLSAEMMRSIANCWKTWVLQT
jgi:hypothetical protein